MRRDLGSRPRVLIAEPEGFSPRALDLLRAAADVELRAWPAGDLAAALAAYDVVWFRLGHRIGRSTLAPGGRCRIVATPVTGLDHIDLAACAEHGVRVLSLRGEAEFLKEVRATAELTIALALALLRGLPGAVAAAAAGRWERDLWRGRELYGKCAGVVGVGRLGRIVASYLRALGMEVVGYDPRPDFPHEAAARAPDLETLLDRADLLTLHVALTPETRGLIGARELARLKPGAIVVNTARGAVLDQAALLEALQSGRLAGAALDVVDGEPDVGPDHPLVRHARSHGNLILTPHIGGNTVESFEKTEVFLAGRVVEALRGEA